MALLDPKQLAQATAVPGQPLVWDGVAWSPDDALRAAVETQSGIIRMLISVMCKERFRIPPELEEYLHVDA